MMTQLVVVTQLVAMTQLVVVVEAGYLYDQHAPAPLPWAASARGGTGILKTNKTTKKTICVVNFAKIISFHILIDL